MRSMQFVVLGLFAMSSAAFAASEPPAAAAQSAPAVAPHSHMQEKTGVQAPVKTRKATPGSNDMSRHNHQRDAK